ncbi:MAG: trypsin-like peptidase domain-containing protein [Candidatus Promineifilaceae bacterium]
MQEELNLQTPGAGRLATWLRRVRSKAQWLWLFVIGITAAVLVIVLYNALFPAPIPITQEEIDDSIVSAMASATPSSAFSAQVYQIILPSLVFIQTEGANSDGEGGFGVGSGVIINEDGQILTANHVIADATSIEVIFADGTHAHAQVVSSEPENDIAVLIADGFPEVIVPAVLGSTRNLRVGDEAYAVGNPLGLPGSMSAGVISGFDRSLPLDDEGIERLEGLIQFDAAVNPGNSGGPLLNRYGQVIGIVTALANPSGEGSFTGIGFAVPIGTAAQAGGGGVQQ